MSHDRHVADEPCAAEASAAVERLCGTSPASVEPVARGVMTFKYTAELPGGEKLVVRLYPRGREEVIRYEPDVMRRCRRAGLPVPEVIGDSRSAAAGSHAYVVYRWIEGVPLVARIDRLDGSTRRRLAARLVECVQVMGELKVAGYGDLENAETARYPSWQAFVDRAFEAGVRAARKHGTLPGELVDDLGRIGKKLSSLEVDPALTWGDVSTENMLVDAHDRLVGLLDFEGALAGDILLNLGYCLARRGRDAWFESLAREWPGGVRGERWDRLHSYAVLRVLRLLPHAHMPLPTGHRRSPIEERFPGFRTAVRSLVS